MWGEGVKKERRKKGKAPDRTSITEGIKHSLGISVHKIGGLILRPSSKFERAKSVKIRIIIEEDRYKSSWTNRCCAPDAQLLYNHMCWKYCLPAANNWRFASQTQRVRLHLLASSIGGYGTSDWKRRGLSKSVTFLCAERETETCRKKQPLTRRVNLDFTGLTTMVVTTADPIHTNFI